MPSVLCQRVDENDLNVCCLKFKNISVWIPIFGYYLHDYIDFLAAVKQLNLDPTHYVTVLLDFFDLGEFKPPWILPDNSINETLKSYFDETIIASFFAFFLRSKKVNI